MRRSTKVLVLLAAAAAFGLASRAEAGLIPTSVTVTPDAGNFRWTYAVVVTTDLKVNTNDYFTIYDFGGLVGGPFGIGGGLDMVVVPVGWELSEALTGPTPAGTGPADDPSTVNLTFTYKGEASIFGQTGLGNFSAISIYSESTTSDFTSITHRTADGRAEANITTTDVPVPGIVEETPEPASFALLGLGVPFAGLAQWLRRRFKK